MQSQEWALGAEEAWFQWRPLDSDPVLKQIRLLILPRGSFDDPIQCRLDHVSLNSCSAYEALSYEWGPLPETPDDEPIIYLDGCLKRVRTSLRDALLHIRLPDRDRYIWIDALCMNQSDEDTVARAEKKRSIMMMGEIYRGASKVVVWLGPATPESDAAMATLNWIQENHPAAEMRDIGFSFISPTLGGSSSNSGEQEVSDAELETLASLCRRSYWTRMWMIQELHLAAALELYCGRSMTTGAAFHSTFDYLYHQANQQPSGNQDDAPARLLQSIPFDFHFNYRQPAYKRDPRKLTFAFWVAQAIEKGFACYKPHDVVYALRGQSYRVADDEAVPDYKKSLEGVFIDAMVAWGTGNLEAEYGSGKFVTRREAVMLADTLLGKEEGGKGGWVERNGERFEELYNKAQEEWWQRREQGKCGFINKPLFEGLVGGQEEAARKKSRMETLTRLREERKLLLEQR